MSFIKESYLAYKKVQEALEKETSDHEIAMARSELEGIADKATATSSMLEGMTESGNPLPAWVQSKITNASDYITSVHDYIKYNPQINESVSLEETTFEKIYQMQQDGKSVDDIAKELKLKPDLVKKVLGESKVISEGLSDAQIAQLKKEYEPLKGKTITTSQYQQLKNILFKLQDGDLEKLQKQNIPFASTGAGSILRVRKGFSHLGTKITNVKVPGLEGMAEEEVKETFKDNIVKKLVKPIQDFNKKKEEPKKEEVSKEKMPVKESHFSMGQHVIYKPKSMTPRKAQIIQVSEPQVGAYYKIKISPTLMTYAKPDELELQEVKEPTGDLKDACWTGYVAVGTKMKNGKRVPNCVPKSEAYKGAKVIVKNAFKKLKEKK